MSLLYIKILYSLCRLKDKTRTSECGYKDLHSWTPICPVSVPHALATSTILFLSSFPRYTSLFHTKQHSSLFGISLFLLLEVSETTSSLSATKWNLQCLLELAIDSLLSAFPQSFRSCFCNALTIVLSNLTAYLSAFPYFYLILLTQNL